MLSGDTEFQEIKKMVINNVLFQSYTLRFPILTQPPQKTALVGLYFSQYL
jgi:hypothetical protein